jgi:hypothetical protein
MDTETEKLFLFSHKLFHSLFNLAKHEKRGMRGKSIYVLFRSGSFRALIKLLRGYKFHQRILIFAQGNRSFPLWIYF